VSALNLAYVLSAVTGAVVAVAGLLLPACRRWVAARRAEAARRRAFLDDWQGEPPRPGVPARPGVMERLAQTDAHLARQDAHLARQDDELAAIQAQLRELKTHMTGGGADER